MGRLFEAAAWAAVCVGVWVLTISPITWQELLLACCAAVACGTAAVGGRYLVGGRWTVRARWLRWLPQLAASAPVETAQTLWAAARRRPGREVAVPLPERERQHVGASRRAVGGVLLSASPGSYLVDSDPEESSLRVHRLGAGAPHAVQIDPGAR